MRKLATEALYNPKKFTSKMPLAEVNRRLQHISAGMVLESQFPPDPNWIINLQNLLEVAHIDLESFVRTSEESGLWPIFKIDKSRLRVSHARLGSGKPEHVFELIQKVYQK